MSRGLNNLILVLHYMVKCKIRNNYKSIILYCKLYVRLIVMDRKLIRNGNGWALTLNKTILNLLKITPDVDMVEYTIEGDKLIITKSPNKRADKK